MISITSYIYFKEIRIGEIVYEERAEKDFSFTIIPSYEIIDSLDGFRGIQGINLELRKEKYVRHNMIPTFIFEHNPLPGKKHFHKAYRINGKTLLEYIAENELKYFGDQLSIRSE